MSTVYQVTEGRERELLYKEDSIVSVPEHREEEDGQGEGNLGSGFGFGKERESLKGGGAACKGPDRLKSAALLTVYGLMP